ASALCVRPPPPTSRLFPYTTLFRSNPRLAGWLSLVPGLGQLYNRQPRKAMTFFIGVAGLFFLSLNVPGITGDLLGWWQPRGTGRSEEHTSELQSRGHLVCRLLLEKK